MNIIDLYYINANYLTRSLSNPLTKEIVNEIIDALTDQIRNDLTTGRGYVSKYDNKFDLMNGTDVRPLKNQLSQIEINLQIISEILKENFKK